MKLTLELEICGTIDYFPTAADSKITSHPNELILCKTGMICDLVWGAKNGENQNLCIGSMPIPPNCKMTIGDNELTQQEKDEVMHKECCQSMYEMLCKLNAKYDTHIDNLFEYFDMLKENLANITRLLEENQTIGSGNGVSEKTLLEALSIVTHSKE